jgi:acyl-CoA synthetase (NDP forming)
LLLADEGVDAVIAVICPTAVGALIGVLPGAGHRQPLAMVQLDQAESVVVLDGGVPSYPYPEDAVKALGHAWSYGRWLARDPGTVPAFDDVRPAEAAEIIEEFLARDTGGGWLPPAQTMTLLGHYGLPMAPWRWAESADSAAGAFAELGGRVVVKAEVTGVIHKTAAGAIQLDLRSQAEVRTAYQWFQSRFGDGLRGVLIQPMEPDGIEVLCGVVQEPVFGPLVVFGLGGTEADALADRAARLTPLTDTDAAEMITSLRATSLFTDTTRPALQDILLRLGRLADDHPQIAELDLNPVIIRPDGTTAVDARIRLQPHQPWDPYLRRLR